MSSYAKGLALTAFGGFILTFDIPLIRAAGGDAWSILATRTALTLAVGLIGWSIWRRFDRDAPPLLPGRKGLLVAMFYGASSLTFLLAVFNTATANVVFILALNSMFAALLSWVFLNERPRVGTLLAMAATLIGIAIIVADGLGSGRIFGDLMAALSTFLLACGITVARSSGQPMGMAAITGTVLPCLVALAMVGAQGGLQIEAPFWIVFNGAVITPIALFCLSTGPRYISGPEVAMFYLLETVLAPIWVWMIFTEVPSRNTLLGGLILVTALVAHSAWQLSAARRRSRAAYSAAIGMP
ncbi:MAG: DMT family transporter [Methylobacterium mesophilicum]|nr:DMT family transporter [Methylobacterium mesophilicum]